MKSRKRTGVKGVVLTLVIGSLGVLFGAPESDGFLVGARALAAPAAVIAPKILTVTMFQTGDPLAGGNGEASIWVKNDHLDQVVPLPGGYSPLYCNAAFDHCLIITGVMAANAAASMMAVGLSDRLDLSHTYIMIAGIGGGPPDQITVGAAAWADWIVSGDLVTELDAREMPPTWQYPKARLACAEPWCGQGFQTGTEVFQLDPTMTAWAFRLSKGVALEDDPKARAYAQNYPEAVARGSPFVTTCAILGINDFTHGKLISQWATWWVSQWTDGKSRYCMSADEEGGTFTSLKRLGVAGRLDMRRVMVLRVATDIDSQYPGETAVQSLVESLNSTFGFVGLDNIYRVGSPVAKEIINNWDRWRDGPPPLPN